MSQAESPFRPGNPENPSLRYLFLRFLRIGFLAWGGPVAQIGLMHREIVERDRWIGETRFKKVLALYQALPGPEAHELAVYFGYLKRGRPGGLVTGLAFMLPGVTLVTLLAVLYTFTAETTRVGQLLLYGARPAVLALILWGFLKLAKRSLTTPTIMPAPLISVGVFVGYLAAGLAGAFVITVTMFAPAFAFTLIGHDFFDRIVNEPRLHEILLGVTAAVIGLILVASVPLAIAAFPDLWTILLGAASLAALLTQRVPIPVALLASSLAGVAIQFVV